eukprot:449441-Rhodomonas_salina.1
MNLHSETRSLACRVKVAGGCADETGTLGVGSRDFVALFVIDQREPLPESRASLCELRGKWPNGHRDREDFVQDAAGRHRVRMERLAQQEMGMAMGMVELLGAGVEMGVMVMMSDRDAVRHGVDDACNDGGDRDDDDDNDNAAAAAATMH